MQKVSYGNNSIKLESKERQNFKSFTNVKLRQE